MRLRARVGVSGLEGDALVPNTAMTPDTVMTIVELAVISLSRHDPWSSLMPPKALALLLFGARAYTPLANPRLEALRRYAILFRLQGPELPESEHERIRAAGYDRLRIEAIEALVAPSRRERHRHPQSSTDAAGQPPCAARQATFPSPTAPTTPRGAKPVRAFVNYLPNTRPRHIAAAAVLSLIFWSASAQAQDQTQDQAAAQSLAEPQEQSKDHIIIGAGAGFAPVYEGADDYRAMPVPAIDITWGRFFANLRNGICINAIDTEHVTIGASVTVMPGYRTRDAPAGIGKLSFGAGGRGFVSLKGAGFVATVGATKGFAGNTKGVIVDASLSRPISVSSRFTLIPSIGTTWADGKNNDRYFGVDEEQSRASGLPQFRPGSGFKDAAAALSAQYRLTNRISLGASAGVTTLLGKVQDSPIVFHKTQPFGFLSLSYRFGS